MEIEKKKELKPIGIMRRLDDLGRVVIPKEIRGRLGIFEGDELEIFMTEDNGIFIKKTQKEIEL